MVLIWQPITDLPEEWNELTEGELAPLLQFWNDQRADLEHSGVLDVFSQRLAREWSIETGQIEGVYHLDRGITETLIERGISADLIPSEPGQRPPEIVAAIIQDHIDVLEGLFQLLKGSRPLSKSYIHEMHAALLRHQDTTGAMDQFGNYFEAQLTKGAYKARPNNPKQSNGSIHQYCPPEQVNSEMERLLSLHEQHNARGIPVELEAAWLHHRFTQIHPYQDGNGRVARALASLLFMKSGWFPLVVTRDDRSRYIDALEVADGGNLESLVAVFVDVQKRALFQAVQATVDIQTVQTVDDAIAAAKKVLTGPQSGLDPDVWLKAKKNADGLLHLAENRFQDLAKSLANEIRPNRPEFQFSVQKAHSQNLPQRVLPYSPNTSDYCNQLDLVISTHHAAALSIQAHAIGPKFRGLIGIVATFRNSSDLQLTSRSPFQVNYAEPYTNIERRFRLWLEDSLVAALTLWRKSL
jgi:fido (protein-threonine AMPylation protein)